MATDHWSRVASPHGVFVPTQQQNGAQDAEKKDSGTSVLQAGQWLSLEGCEGGDTWT